MIQKAFVFLASLIAIPSFSSLPSNLQASQASADESILIESIPFLYPKNQGVKKEHIASVEAQLIDYVRNSIIQANALQGSLSQEVLDLPGMTSSKGRFLLNNLCSMPRVNYLEIGAWKGSSFVSAMFGNEKTVNAAYAIDNWTKQGVGATDYGYVREEFLGNVQKFIPLAKVKIVEENAFSLKAKSQIDQKINVYFYDAGHSLSDQRAAFTYYNDVFDDVFVAVVDDWNWDWIRQGTFEAFDKLGYEILFQEYLLSNHFRDGDNYWNGMYVAVIKKKK